MIIPKQQQHQTIQSYQQTTFSKSRNNNFSMKENSNDIEKMTNTTNIQFNAITTANRIKCNNSKIGAIYNEYEKEKMEKTNVKE